MLRGLVGFVSVRYVRVVFVGQLLKSADALNDGTMLREGSTGVALVLVNNISIDAEIPLHGNLLRRCLKMSHCWKFDLSLQVGPLYTRCYILIAAFHIGCTWNNPPLWCFL